MEVLIFWCISGLEGKIVHRAPKTFDRRVSADAWIKRREADLAKPNAVLGAAKVPIATLGDAINRYILQSERAMGRTKTQVLRSILKYDIANMVCAEIGSQHYLELAQALAATGMKPQTVENYLSHLGAVVSIARPAWGFALDPQALSDGRKVADIRRTQPPAYALPGPREAQPKFGAYGGDYRLCSILDASVRRDHSHRLD